MSSSINYFLGIYEFRFEFAISTTNIHIRFSIGFYEKPHGLGGNKDTYLEPEHQFKFLDDVTDEYKDGMYYVRTNVSFAKDAELIEMFSLDTYSDALDADSRRSIIKVQLTRILDYARRKQLEAKQWKQKVRELVDDTAVTRVDLLRVLINEYAYVSTNYNASEQLGVLDTTVCQIILKQLKERDQFWFCIWWCINQVTKPTFFPIHVVKHVMKFLSAKV